MIIDIDRIPHEGLEIQEDFDFVSADLVDESAVFLKPVRADVTIHRIGDEVMLKGQIETTLSFICSRCLSPYEFPVCSQFDLVYFPDELEEIKEELESEDIKQYYYQSPQVDLHEVILEQLNLTFPVKPLCREGCQGICPVCGKLVREGRCSCVISDTDPRLDKLRFLIKR